MSERPGVRWLFTGCWGCILVELQSKWYATLLFKNYDIQETTCRSDRQPEWREILRKGGENRLKLPRGLSQTVNTSMNNVPQKRCSAGFSICITNMIEPVTCTTVHPHRATQTISLVHSASTELMLLWNLESSSSIHHNRMSETGIWDTCECGPKIGLIDWQHGGLREGQQVEHDERRSAGLHKSNIAKAQSTLSWRFVGKSV